MIRTRAFIAILALIAIASPSYAQATFVPPSGTTTYPSSPPSNSPGTTGVPLYSKADGAAYFDLLDPVPAGSNVIGGVTQSGTWTVTGTFWPYTLGQQLANVSVPVVLTAAQLTTLTPPTNAGYALDTSVNGLLLSQGSATSGAKGVLHLGAVTTSAPTYTTAQNAPLSLTTSGGLRVDGSAVTQPVSGSVTANAGSGTFAVSASALPLPTGAATAASQTNVQSAAGTPSSTVVSVQGNASGVAMPVSGTFWPYTLGQQVAGSSVPVILPSATITTLTPPAAITGFALDTSVNGLLVSQGSTTSGQKGTLAVGAVTTSAPTYTTAQTSPLSLTTSGALRVDTGGSTQTVSGTVTANAGSGTMAVSAASLPLPAGASTAANQTAPQSAAGTPDSTAVTIQGNASGVAVPVSGTVTANAGTGTMNTSATGAAASGASNTGNPVKIGGAFNTTQPTLSNGQVGDEQVTSRGAQIVATGVDTFNATINAALPAGTNSIGTVQIGNTANTTPILVTQSPATSGGSSISGVLSAASTNLTSVKSSAGQVYGWQFSDAAAYWVYVHFYNVASGSVTVGTTAPTFTIGVPPGGAVAYRDDNGLAMGTAISYSITKGAAATDATATLANDCMGVISYK